MRFRERDRTSDQITDRLMTLFLCDELIVGAMYRFYLAAAVSPLHTVEDALNYSASYLPYT